MLFVVGEVRQGELLRACWCRSFLWLVSPVLFLVAAPLVRLSDSVGCESTTTTEITPAVPRISCFSVLYFLEGLLSFSECIAVS